MRCMLALAALMAGLASLASAQEVPKDGPSNELDSCRAAALVNLREKSPQTKDVVIDPDASIVAKADTIVGDTPIKGVAMGEAYLDQKGTGKPYRFVCLISTGGKVVLTFFTQQ